VAGDAVQRHSVQSGSAAATAGRRRSAPTVRRTAIAVAAAALLSVFGGERIGAHDPVTTKITYAREIRAILQARCASCHSPGAPAPMPFSTYEEVRPWARAIKTQVLTRHMPKWHAAHGYGAFANDPSLTQVEMAIVAAWVDGGQPRGATVAEVPEPIDASAFSQKALPVSVPAATADAAVAVTPLWIAGWDFEAGDPLVTSATFTSATGAPIGTWVAGDMPVQLPPNSGIHIASPIHVQIQRRASVDYEKPFTPRPSVLRLLPRVAPPFRRVWVEPAFCGAPRTGGAADLLAVRPLLRAGGAVRLWLERPGSPRTIVGWFRDYETLYPRAYWLARPMDLPPESRLAGDSACTVELTLASR
jgi:mono/diheme cytochrome c family protein